MKKTNKGAYLAWSRKATHITGWRRVGLPLSRDRKKTWEFSELKGQWSWRVLGWKGEEGIRSNTGGRRSHSDQSFWNATVNYCTILRKGIWYDQIKRLHWLLCENLGMRSVMGQKWKHRCQDSCNYTKNR